MLNPVRQPQAIPGMKQSLWLTILFLPRRFGSTRPDVRAIFDPAYRRRFLKKM
jgi:hypothetical protein